jgi:hypothetical protein
MYTIPRDMITRRETQNLRVSTVQMPLRKHKTEEPISLSSVYLGRASITTGVKRQIDSQMAFDNILWHMLEILNDERSAKLQGRLVTDRASVAVFSLLISINEIYGLVDGDIYPDGDGGLRLEFEHDVRQVRLSLHADDPREDYLYWEDGMKYAIETPLCGAMVTGWLRWLRGTLK